MSICSTLAEHDLINLRKLAEQQKNQRGLVLKTRNLKQTHDFKFAENCHQKPNKIEGVKKSTQN